MSALTRCNSCTVNDMQKRAKELGWKLSTKASALRGGIDVYIHPVGVKPVEEYRKGRLSRFRTVVCAIKKEVHHEG